jgi:hypothetical protein
MFSKASGPIAIAPRPMFSSAVFERSICPSVIPSVGGSGRAYTSASVTVLSGTPASRVPASTVSQPPGVESGMSDRCTPPRASASIAAVNPMLSIGMFSTGMFSSAMFSTGMLSTGMFSSAMFSTAVPWMAPPRTAAGGMLEIGTSSAPAITEVCAASKVRFETRGLAYAKMKVLGVPPVAPPSVFGWPSE